MHYAQLCVVTFLHSKRSNASLQYPAAAFTIENAARLAAVISVFDRP